MKYRTINVIISVLIPLFIGGCKEDPERHLKLGKWYAQKGLVEEAILEFKEVTRLFPEKVQSLSREEYQVLSKAHYNLSLMYTKKGWWEFALDAIMSGKNRTILEHGYSPAQHLFGRQPTIPAELGCEQECVVSRSMAQTC